MNFLNTDYHLFCKNNNNVVVSKLMTMIIMNSIIYTLQLESLSVTFHEHDLIVNSELELKHSKLVHTLVYKSCSSIIDLLLFANDYFFV